MLARLPASFPRDCVSRVDSFLYTFVIVVIDLDRFMTIIIVIVVHQENTCVCHGVFVVVLKKQNRNVVAVKHLVFKSKKMAETKVGGSGHVRIVRFSLGSKNRLRRYITNL